MLYANGKEAKPGDHVVGRDCGGNLITGSVMLTGLRGENLRVQGVPLVVPAADCLLCDDAYLAAMAPINEARAKAKAEAEAKAAAAAKASADQAPLPPGTTPSNPT